jgi:hypothetical protein
MDVLAIRCPSSGREFSTGIEVQAQTVAKLLDVRNFTRCPYCGMAHGWRVPDARLADESQKMEHGTRASRSGSGSDTSVAESELSQWIVRA